ncbi:unnamed protein product, partial [Rotaria sordida]
HGTSPLTRQPLQINDLQPDDRLRHLAHQGRNSTVSYNAHNASIILPPLRRLSININARVAPEQTSNLTRITRQDCYIYACINDEQPTIRTLTETKIILSQRGFITTEMIETTYILILTTNVFISTHLFYTHQDQQFFIHVQVCINQ